MSLAAISRYPDLEVRYLTNLAVAKAKRSACGDCDVNKVKMRFEVLLNERLARDKLLKRQ